MTHNGVHEEISELNPRTYFLLDANVCIKIKSKEYSQQKEQSLRELIEFLRYSQNRYSYQKNGGYPVDLSLAAAENSWQDKIPRFIKFKKEYKKVFDGIFPGHTIDPNWIQRKHENTKKAVIPCKNSIEAVIAKINSLAKKKPSSNREILQRCDDLINFHWNQRKNMPAIIGHIFHLGIYAIAGNPEARRLLKIDSPSEKSDRNVAWDLMYFIYHEIDYIFDDMTNTAICTYDKDLKILLKQRIKQGPRYGPLEYDQNAFDSFGELNGFKLQRIDESNLSNEIRKRLARFWDSLAAFSDDGIAIGLRKPPIK